MGQPRLWRASLEMRLTCLHRKILYRQSMSVSLPPVLSPLHTDSDSDGEGVRGEGVEGGLEKGLEKGTVETEVPRINVEIPRCAANLGSDQYFVKLPNFLSVDTRWDLASRAEVYIYNYI